MDGLGSGKSQTNVHPRIVMLTGIEYHCRYAANCVSRHFPFVGIVIEGGSESAHRSTLLGQYKRLFGAARRRLMPNRQDRAAREANAAKEKLNDRFLGDGWRTFREDRLGRVLRVERSGINHPSVAEFLRSSAPDIVVVFGTSILKRNLLESVSGLCLNMHTGLVPAYRGTHSAEWAILNGDLAGVGVTIHHVVAGVDTGPIVIQGRPQLTEDDTPAFINLKLYALASELMVRAIRSYAETAGLEGVEQELSSGRNYRRVEYTDEARRRLAKVFDSGRFKQMIREHQRHSEDADLVDCTTRQECGQPHHCGV